MCGLLGPASALEKKSPLVSDQVVGVGGTTAWKLCTLAAGTSLAVVYDIVAQHGAGAAAGDPMAGGGQQQQFFLQFVTRYLHDSGAMRCRVTTITRRRARSRLAGWMDGWWMDGWMGARVTAAVAAGCLHSAAAAASLCAVTFASRYALTCHAACLPACLQVGGGQQPRRPDPGL